MEVWCNRSGRTVEITRVQAWSALDLIMCTRRSYKLGDRPGHQAQVWYVELIYQYPGLPRRAFLEYSCIDLRPILWAYLYPAKPIVEIFMRVGSSPSDVPHSLRSVGDNRSGGNRDLVLTRRASDDHLMLGASPKISGVL